MRISDWSSDVCSSDLHRAGIVAPDFAMHFGWPIGCEPSIAVGDHRAPRRTGAGAGHFEADLEDSARRQPKSKIGRASCRERVCQYVEISGVAVSLKKKTTETHNSYT